jgi:hypothetical protein
MQAVLLYEKAKRKLRGILLQKIAGTAFQFSLYRSYWHMRLAGKSKNKREPGLQHFIAQKPNYGAGIGHQLANWNAGYYFSQFYHLSFAHFPFSNIKWEHLLGFGEKETSAGALLKDSSFRKVKLPRFDSEKEQDIVLIGNILQSYRDNKILFLLAQDQGYMRQCDTYIDLSEKFFTAPARKENKLFYTAGHFNIAIHIRRGDVADMKQSGDSNWEQRWLNNDYFVNVLQQVLAAIPASKDVQVYIFSQGKKEDYPEFSQFSHINYCLDTNAYESFVHMVYADLLISSKSSFSYKPALLSKGIKICPGNFWHSYPSTNDFILADNDGTFDREKLLINLGVC